MASSTAPHSEKSKIDTIVSEFFPKALHVILDSRIPNISTPSYPDGSPHHSASLASSSSPSSRWFNLEMNDCAAAAESAEHWRRNPMEPMVIDIMLQQPMAGEIPSPSGIGPKYFTGGNFKGYSPSRGNSSGDSWSGEGEGCVSPGGVSRTLLERWVVQHVLKKKGVSGGGSGATKIAAGFVDGSGSFGKGAAKGIGASGPPLPYPHSHVWDWHAVYKKLIIMLRSLYCTTRTLPAHRLFRLVNSSSHSRSFTLSYKVSAAPLPLTEADETSMMTFNLTPVETTWGRICMSVAYRHTTAVTALEITPPILPRIIYDYVGSPTTDPLRRFSNVGSVPGGFSGRRGVHVISLPSSVPSSPSGPSFGRRHSWSAGLHKFPPVLTAAPSGRASRSPSPSQPADFNRSPPMLPSPYPSSPSSNTHFSHSPRTSPSRPSFPRPYTSQPSSYHNVGSGNPSPPIPIREHGRSPPFSPSPSPSPPTPSHHNPSDGSGRLRSAPMSIPRHSSARPNIGSSPRPPLTEGPPQHQARIQYPPPSPGRNPDNISRALSTNTKLWTGLMPNIFIPNIDGRVAPRLSISTLAESSLLVSPPHPFYPNQVGDDKVEEGPPSGVKRSLYAPARLITLGPRSTKVGSDIDGDEEFSCPFAVDEDEAEEYRSRMESPRIKQIGDPFEQGHHKSQDAAAGALVRVLKYAQPLRHGIFVPLVTSGSPSPRLTFPTSGNMGSGKLKNSPPIPTGKTSSGTTFLVGSPSSQPLGGRISQKTSGFALEELRSYVEMRDHLLRQSGGKLQSSSPGKHI